MRPHFLTLIVLGSFAACARPPVTPQAAKVDAVFADWDRPDSPGCGVGISRGGAVVYERGYGMADVDRRAPITTESVFHVASVSKQFTAMSVLLLVQRGQLSLDDDVRKHIPDWAASGRGPTIQQLLTHTSGLRDAFLLRELAPPSVDPDLNRELVTRLVRQRGLNFSPGSEFQYSNSGYVLLAELVRRTSGQSLRALTEKDIFKPLGMANTHVHDDPAMVVPNRANGYRRDGGRWNGVPHADLGRLVGTTGLLTTVRDLLRWQQNFAQITVGDPALVAAMQTPATLTSGEETGYGFGLFVGNDQGVRRIGHGGGDPGVSAESARFPDRGLAVAVLCNVEGVASALASRVAAIYLGNAAEPKPGAPAPSSVTLPPDQLASKVGLYRDTATGWFGRVFVRDGKLMASPDAGTGRDSVALTPVGEDRFVITGTSIAAEFVPGAAGRPLELHVTGQGPKPVVLRQVPTPFVPSSKELMALTGRYVCPDLDAIYIVIVRDGALVVQPSGRADITLQPLVPDAFHGSLIGTVTFTRDARGAVQGFTSDTAGVRGLRFDRVRDRRGMAKAGAIRVD